METVEAGRWVKIRYRLELTKEGSEEGIDANSKGEHEAIFIYGVEEQVPSLEAALKGAKKGDEMEFTVPPEELYGSYRPSLVKEIPKKGLLRQRLKEGQYYRQIKRSALVSFKVLKVNEDTVLADFNPPLAGIGARLWLKVLDVWQASEEEIKRASESQAKRKIGCG